MRFILLLATLCIRYASSAQATLPIVRANSQRALILEGADEHHAWQIDPAVKLDVHIITKSPAAKWVCFRTDVDSIRVRLRHGQQFDFWVLLNGTDTCLTRLVSPSPISWARRPATHDTLPFVLTEFNNIKLKAVINETDTLDLKFDSGTTGLLLTNEAIRHKIHPEKPGGNKLRLGHLTWDSLQIYPVELSGQGTDGRFGWDLFDGRVVEIDYDHSRFIVHSRLPPIGKAYARLPIQYSYGLFCIRAQLEAHGKKYPSRFLVDNGYQRTLMLDTALLARQRYPQDMPVIKKTIMRNGQGQEITRCHRCCRALQDRQPNAGRHTRANAGHRKPGPLCHPTF